MHSRPLSSPSNQPETQTHPARRVLLNTGALAGSSLWRIGMSFFLQLFIANQLGVEGLGQYAAVMAYLNVCQVMSELGLPQLLVRDLARFPKRRRSYFQAALAGQILASILVAALLIGISFWLPFESVTRTALCLVVLSLPFYAVTSICETLFQSSERMELVMGVEVSINTLIFISSLAVLQWQGDVTDLATVIIGTQMVSAIICLLFLRHYRLLQGTVHVRLSALLMTRLLWRKVRPFYALALTNVLLNRVDILLLSAVAGEVVTGIYSAAYLIVRVFLILGQTYWQAFYPTLSRLRQQNIAQYHRLAQLGLRYGLILLLPLAALTSPLADLLLRLIFRSESYAESVPVFSLLIWATPLFFIATYAVNILLVERKPQISLLVAAIHLAIIALTLPLLATRFDALGAGWSVFAAVGLSAGAGIWLLNRVDPKLGVSMQWLWIFGQTALLALFVFGIIGLVSRPLWPWLSLLGGALYVAGLWYTRFISLDDLNLFRRALSR